MHCGILQRPDQASQVGHFSGCQGGLRKPSAIRLTRNGSYLFDVLLLAILNAEIIPLLESDASIRKFSRLERAEVEFAAHLFQLSTEGWISSSNSIINVNP